MKTFLYVLYTWLLANAVHPLIWILSEKIINNNVAFDAIAFGFFVFFFSILFSLPALFMVWVGCFEILKTNYSGVEKLFLWYIVVIIATLGDIVLLTTGFFDENLSFDSIKMGLPALAAGFIAITIRYKYFFNLNHIYKQQVNQQ